jgi:hypothetical protein
VLDDAAIAEAARRAAEFVIGNLYDATSGTLLRRFRAGDAAIPAFSTTTPCSSRDCSISTKHNSIFATWNWPYA